jgi:hypothetical protein
VKGVDVKQLRATVLSVLDKMEQLLTTEPARLIGYGAAAVVFLSLEVLNAKGIINFGKDMTFEQTVGLAFGAITVLVTVIESIRRFVYSPMTYIEDLSDAWQEGHDEAHAEEALRELVQQKLDERKQQGTIIPVAPAPEDNPDRPN